MAHIIGKCLKDSGAKGCAAASAFVYLEIFFALVSYTSPSATKCRSSSPAPAPARQRHLPRLCLGTAQLLTAITVLVVLPSLWLRDLSSVSFLSLARIAMSLLIFGSVVVCATASGGLGKCIPALRPERIPAVSGPCMFSYAWSRELL